MKNFNKLKLIFYLSLLFLAGVVTGAFLTFQVVRHLMPNQERLTARWSGELRSKLDLTPEQVQKIEPIIKETIGAFKTTLGHDLRSALTNCNARITLQLNASQKIKFERLEQEQREFISRKFGAGPAPASNDR